MYTKRLLLITTWNYVFFCCEYRFLEMLKMFAKIDNGNSKNNIF